MNKVGERLWNGLVKENPTLVLMLGMCPTLAVTTSAVNGFGMGATTLVVLALSNLIISLLRKVIPKRVRIPAFIVIIASFVTMVQLLLQAYLYSLNKALGVYIPLIVVNCIILGRAESYAYSNPPIPALFDGIGMGLGFTVALTCIGAVRELLGAGQLFGFPVMPDSYEPALIFVLAPGAFFVLAALTALQNFVKEKLRQTGKPYEKIGSGCTEDCMNCSDTGCARRFYDVEAGQQTPQEQEAEPTEEPEVTEELKPEPEPEVTEELKPEPEPEATEEQEPEQGAEMAVASEPESEPEQGSDVTQDDEAVQGSGATQDDEAVQGSGATQDDEAVQGSGATQDKKPVQGSRTPQNHKVAQSSKGVQNNKVAHNNAGRSAQYDQASQSRKPKPHRKVPRQGRKK